MSDDYTPSPGRSRAAQLATARLLLAQFDAQIEQHDQTGAHADRIDQLHAGRATWQARVDELTP